MSLHESLVKIQKDLKAPKSQKNTFGNYKYRSCEDILEAAKPLLSEHKLVLTLSDSIEVVGTRFYVKATATLGIVGTNEQLMVHAYAREEETKKGMDGSQITGAASSYARKYALNGLFCIDDTADSDATNEHGKGEQKPAAKPAPKPAAKPVQPAKEEKPAERKQPSAITVMEWLNATKDEKQTDTIYERAIKYPWSEADKKAIDECRDNVKKRNAEAEMQAAERAGMAA